MYRKLLFVLALVAFSSLAFAGPYTHFAYLNSYQETPPALTSTGSGWAVCELVGDDLYYSVSWSGLTSTVSNAHIHAANVGVAGGVVHGLQNLTQTSANGVWLNLTPVQIASLNAHGLYFNVHTSTYPGGEIRGQILTRGTCIASLDPQQEVQTPPVVSNGRGFGWFRLNAAETNVEYAIAWAGLNAPGTVSAAHFHRAAAGVSGPVIVGLQNLTNISASGNWAITAADLPLFKTAGVYVNVHTPAPNYPGGEIRGQIICPCIPEHAVFDATTDLGESQCISLCADQSSYIRVWGVPQGQFPVVTKRFGCANPCDFDCEPTEYIQEFFTNWQWTDGWFWLEIRGNGCACISLDLILPVELKNFDAVAGNAAVTLSWSTASETNLDRFEVTRDGMTLASIAAQNSASGADYSWVDANVENGTTYSYTLSAINLDGSREVLSTVSATPQDAAEVVTGYALHQNYPNPFNPETNISFDLAEAGHVTLKVFNVNGQEIAKLANSYFAAGRHNLSFDGANLSSGVYLYQITVNGFTAQHKMVLMK